MRTVKAKTRAAPNKIKTATRVTPAENGRRHLQAADSKSTAAEVPSVGAVAAKLTTKSAGKSHNVPESHVEPQGVLNKKGIAALGAGSGE